MAKRPGNQAKTGRDAKGRFPKGVSGNPNGRPRVAEALAQHLRDLEKGRLEKAVNLMWDKAARGDIHAFEFLVDHGWGKLPIQVETWEDRVLEAIKSRQVGKRELAKEFGEDLAEELFRKAGIEVK